MRDVLFWLGTLLDVYGFVLLLRMFMSLVVAFTQYRPTGAAAVAFELVYSATDPPLRLLRRWIPPINMGRFSFDTSFIVLVIGLRIIAVQLKGW